MKTTYKLVDGKLVEVKPEKGKINTLIKTSGPGLNWSYKSGSKTK